MKLSVIAPMYNEEANIHSSFYSIKKEIEEKITSSYEILFVNDGSLDKSKEIAEELAKTEPTLRVLGYAKNQGRGKALRTGFDAAKGEIIITIDFDLSYDTSHISSMYNSLIEDENLDTVLASCYMPGGKTIGISKFRLFVSKTANSLYRYAFEPKIYTSTCVVRAYKKEAIKSLELESNDKEIHLEIISKLLANNFKIKEIPGTLKSRKKGKSSFKFRAHSISHIIFFIQEKPFALFGMLGMLLFVLGFISASVLIITRFGNIPGFKESFISRISSPSFVIILFLAGFQILGLGFLGIQNNMLKKELFKIQSKLKK